MKTCFLALVLAYAVLPAVAEAQNVLVPSSSTTTAKPAAAAPTQVTSTDVVPTAPLPAALSTVGQSMPAMPTQSYISASQQNAMIQMEQKNLALAQQGLVQTQQVDQLNALQAAAPNQTQGTLGTLNTSQQTNAGSKASLNARVATIQHRLAILQSGPLTPAQFAALYQSN